MGGVEDDHWIDTVIDEIGFALTKADETIKKSIEFWKELTKDLFDDQPNQDSTRQSNNDKSCEEHSSNDKPVTEVKERLIQHWSMRVTELKDEPMRHMAIAVGYHDDDDGDDSDNDVDDHDDDDEEEDEDTSSQSCENMSGLNWYLRSILEESDDGSATEEDDESWDDNDYVHQEEEDEATVSVFIPQEEEEEDDESWDDDDYVHQEEEDKTTVSESCENMSELEFGASATSYSLSWYYRRNEEDNGSNLKWRGGYELLNDVDDDEDDDDDDDNDDDDDECYSEGAEEMMEWWRKHRTCDASNGSLEVHLDDDDVSDTSERTLDMIQEKIASDTEFSDVKTISSECDWVYVTMDQLGF